GGARRRPHRRHQLARYRLRRQPVEPGDRLRHPDRDPHLPAQRPSGRPHPGEGMTLRGALGYWMVAGFVLLAAVPFLPGRYVAIYGTQLIPVLCFAILALGLNVVVGYTGLLHLGIAAFFGIGAYAAAILSTSAFPF